jgi:hypothetical protein
MVAVDRRHRFHVTRLACADHQVLIAMTGTSWLLHIRHPTILPKYIAKRKFIDFM